MLQKGTNVTKRNNVCYKKDPMLQKGIRQVTQGNTDVTKRNNVCYKKDPMLQKGP